MSTKPRRVGANPHSDSGRKRGMEGARPARRQGHSRALRPRRRSRRRRRRRPGRGYSCGEHCSRVLRVDGVRASPSCGPSRRKGPRRSSGNRIHWSRWIATRSRRTRSPLHYRPQRREARSRRCNSRRPRATATRTRSPLSNHACILKAGARGSRRKHRVLWCGPLRPLFLFIYSVQFRGPSRH